MERNHTIEDIKTSTIIDTITPRNQNGSTRIADPDDDLTVIG